MSASLRGDSPDDYAHTEDTRTAGPRRPLPPQSHGGGRARLREAVNRVGSPSRPGGRAAGVCPHPPQSSSRAADDSPTTSRHAPAAARPPGRHAPAADDSPNASRHVPAADDSPTARPPGRHAPAALSGSGSARGGARARRDVPGAMLEGWW